MGDRKMALTAPRVCSNYVQLFSVMTLKYADIRIAYLHSYHQRLLSLPLASMKPLSVLEPRQ